MANTITLKKSGVAGRVPTTASLSLGEIALNYKDGNLFYRDNESSPAVHKINAGDADTVDGFHLNQDVRTTGSPSFAGLTVDTDTLSVDATNNRVGIGTTSPSRQLELRGQGVIRLNATSGGDSGLDFNTSDVNDMQIRYRSATDALAIYSYGTSSDVVTIRKSDGNVGIGTTSPAAKVEIAESLSGAPANDNANLKLTDMANFAADVGGSVLFSGKYNAAGSILGQGPYIKASKANANDGDYGFGLNFGVRGSGSGGSNVAMTITESSNVGIGTTSPSTKLHIDDSATLGTGLLVTGGGQGGPLARFTRDVGGTGTITISSSGSDPQINFASSANTFALGTNGSAFEICDNGAVGTNTRLSINSSGNVGIGTTTPNKNLTVTYSNSSTDRNNSLSGAGVGSGLLINNTSSANGSYANLDFRSGSADARILYSYNGTGNSGDFHFITDNTASFGTKLFIGDSGNVGIGDTTPSYKLDVNGTFRSTGIANLDSGAIVTSGGISINSGDLNVSSGDVVITDGVLQGPSRFIIDPSPYESPYTSPLNNSPQSTGEIIIRGDLEVEGHLAATTKSFLVDNPRTGGKLQYGVVESDEHGVYVRGKTDQNMVELPEEWEWLVDEDSVTVQLTSIGQMQNLFVIEQNNKYITVGGLAHNGQYNYVIYGTRKDVDPLEKHL